MGLKFFYFRKETLQHSILKSDQNGIEIKTAGPQMGEFIRLKSDQNGIEILIYSISALQRLSLKSDQNGIEIDWKEGDTDPCEQN